MGCSQRGVVNKAAVAAFSLDGQAYKVSNGDSGDGNPILAGAGVQEVEVFSYLF
jgi:hypothetical protein